jgi:hypothetical protein
MKSHAPPLQCVPQNTSCVHSNPLQPPSNSIFLQSSKEELRPEDPAAAQTLEAASSGAQKLVLLVATTGAPLSDAVSKLPPLQQPPYAPWQLPVIGHALLTRGKNEHFVHNVRFRPGNPRECLPSDMPTNQTHAETSHLLPVCAAGPLPFSRDPIPTPPRPRPQLAHNIWGGGGLARNGGTVRVSLPTDLDFETGAPEGPEGWDDKAALVETIMTCDPDVSF